MLWVVRLIDKPKPTAIRAEHQAAHSAYLKKMDLVGLFARPLQNHDATQSVGSLWIIKADSRAKAQAFVDNEVFLRAGVFEGYTINRVRMVHLHPELVSG